jgi:tRNA(adenine34) deaminase
MAKKQALNEAAAPENGQAAVDVRFMREALRQAKKAAALSETPIGCVIVRDGQIIARGYNRRNTEKSTLEHAEIRAIRKAVKAVGDWRLEGCTLTVTLEPCPMCAGAIINARIPTVVYGAKEPVFGSCGSVIDLFFERYGHTPRVYGGVKEQDCAGLLKAFFAARR